MNRKFDDIKRFPKKKADTNHTLMAKSSFVSGGGKMSIAEEFSTTAQTPPSPNAGISGNGNRVVEVRPGFFIPKIFSGTVDEGSVLVPRTQDAPTQIDAPTQGKTSDSSAYFSALQGVVKHKKENVPVRVVLGGDQYKRVLNDFSSVSHKPVDVSLSSRKHAHIPWKSILLFLGIVIVAGITLFLIVFFSTARISITPRQEAVSISGSFSAKRGGEELSFEVMSISAEESVEVSADEKRQVDERATGSILIYNDYSQSPQRLVKNTRFAATDGKVFRIRESVVVPGQMEEGGKRVPGSVEAVVVADEPGERYNIGLTDFTIPGFKGDPRHEKFYVRSKTDMTGGFSGVRNFPSEQIITETRQQLRTALNETLGKNARAQTPDGFILYSAGTKIVLADDPSVVIDGSKAMITERGMISGVIFKEDELSQYLAKKSLASFDGEKINIPDIEEIDFSFSNEPTFEENEILFTLNGSAHIIWHVDTDGLVKAIAGKPRTAFDEILGSFSNVRRAEASIRPFFIPSFPKDHSRITAELIVE